MNSAAAEPSVTDRAVASPQPSDATARFDRYFNPEKFLRDICIGLPAMSATAFCELTGEELPLFLSDPSEDFIAAMHRDVLPLLETLVRRVG